MKLLESKQIKIGEIEYTVRLCVAAMLKYESLSGHSISEIRTLQDRVNIFFASFNICNPEIPYEKFLVIINPYPDVIGEFMSLNFDLEEKKQKGR
jgi:hypothetical protein